MKRIILIIVTVLMSLSIMAQAHLGIPISEIKARYPDKTFKYNVSSKGTIYYTADMQYGNFSYWMNDAGVCYQCIQIPYSMITLNGQIEAYNKKYVINSKDSWTAYLEGGYQMQIELYYDKEDNLYFFTYLEK